jgi:hypothetical protein
MFENADIGEHLGMRIKYVQEGRWIIVIEWTTLLLYIWKVLISVLVPETNCL